MKLKIFTNQSSFKGVLYNINKVSSDRAELMCAENFHALGILRNIMPQDYINYLMTISAASIIKKPQFHMVISCKEELKNKWELTDIAKAWLDKMGYGKQPYLIFFHYDTDVNHVHIVSSRVNREGKSIYDSFEGIRGYSELNQILGIDPQKQAEQDITKALSYEFSSRMEFIMLLYALGYVSQIKDGSLILIRHGRKHAELSLEIIYGKISHNQQSSLRIDELKEIFSENLKKYDSAIRKGYVEYQKNSSYPIRCTSEFIKQLKKNYDIQLIFHGNSRRLPTHYCIIDHQRKNIFEGNQVWPLAEFIRPINNNIIAQNITPIDSLDLHRENIDSEITEGAWASIGNIDIIEEMDPQALNKKRKNKKDTQIK